MLTIPELEAAWKVTLFKPVDCPHCGERLNAHFRLVVATRNCPKCGKRVVAEPEGNDGPLPYTHEQLHTACVAYLRIVSRAVWLFFAAVVWLLVFFFAVVFFPDVLPNAMQSLREPGSLRGLIALGPFAALSLPAVVILHHATRNAMKCPHCAYQCAVLASHDAPNLALLTDNCANCGRTLLSKTPEEPPGVLPPVSEFTTVRDQAMRPDWTGLLVVATVIATVVALLVVANPEQLLEMLVARHGLPTGATAAVAVLVGCVLGLGGIAALGLRWLKRRHLRRWATIPVLNCPHCSEKLLLAHLVVASQRCPACRKRVLADPEAVTAEG